MNGIETFRFGTVQVPHLRSDNLQAGVLETGVNLADDILGNCIGFDNRQGALNSHVAFSKHK